MSEVFISTAWNLIVAAVVMSGGVLLWWVLLRLLDRANGVDFFTVVHNFRYPEIYFGLRAIAAAILIGWLVGRRII